MVSSLLASSLRTSTTTASRASINNRRRTLIVDTDMGFDDVLALSILAQQKKTESTINLGLICTSTGMNEAAFGARVARRLFPTTPVVAGGIGPPESCRGPKGEGGGNDSWLPAYRRRFRDFAVRNEVLALDECSSSNGGGMSSDENGPHGALEAVIDTLQASPDGGCDLMCLGPLTNVAAWLRSSKGGADLMAKKLDTVWLLGGNHPHGGGEGGEEEAEFNFKEDVRATVDVLSSPHLAGKLCVVSADVSGAQSTMLARGLVDAVGTAAEGGRGLLSDVLRTDPKAVFFDPVCTFAYTDPDRVQFADLNVSVDPQSGLVVEDISARPGTTTVAFMSHIDSTLVQREYIDWIDQAIKLETGKLS